MAKWYDDTVDAFMHQEAVRQAEKGDALLAFVLKAAVRRGQQVARFDEYTTVSAAGGMYQHEKTYHRVKITFVDGSWVRGWYFDGRWNYADRTWERVGRGRQWWKMTEEARTQQ